MSTHTVSPLRRLRDCFFAFVDEGSAAFVVATAPKAVLRAGEVSNSRVGAWRLLTLPRSSPPYPQPRRASRVPKLLPFRFFPRANFSLWLDGKLKLLAPPKEVPDRGSNSGRSHPAAANSGHSHRRRRCC